MPKVTTEGIKLDEIIYIQVSGGFYSRLHQLLQSLASTVTPEEFQKCITKITQGNADSALEYHLETIIVLINEIETKAKTQGKISKQDVEISED